MKTIAFIRRGASLREYNMAYALKKSGRYKTIHISQGMDKETRKLFSQVFDKIITYNSLNVTNGKKESFILYLIKHIFNHHINNRLGVMNEKHRLPKILCDKIDIFNCLIKPYALSSIVMDCTSSLVFDAYDFDGVTIGIENLSSLIFNWEKNAFEQAQGIIHRGGQFEIDYYKQHGYNMMCPELEWLDYANKQFFVCNPNKLSNEDGEWHLVHIGSAVTPEFVSFAKKICNQDMHLHVYPTSSMSPLTYRRLKNMDKDNRYFHLHDTLPFDKINQEIAKYDYGCHFYFNQMHKMGLRVAHCHRFFNYLEAGLPIIVSDFVHGGIKKTVIDNRVGFAIRDMDFRILPNIINRYDYDELRKNVLVAREELLIDNHVEKLINFYDSMEVVN